ncbi:MAG: type II toxin-antitoxin system HipA family toxin [Kiritimatiellae bacterium]|nr:type II toxin-antitoxin system HipA family toxin [Kiritimatiellia bacterium]
MTLRVSLRFSADRTIPVGTLSESGRDTAFEYDLSFLSAGLNPAPLRLPVGRGVTVFDRSGDMDTFGMFEDSMPDGWGRRLVDTAFRKKHGRLPTALERLACVGQNGMGALVYEPADGDSSVPEDLDLSEIAADAMDFDAGLVEDVLPEVRRAGGSSGGARPKAFIGFNPESGEVCAERERLPSGFEHWLVKFNTRREGDSAGETEYRYHLMAVASGVEMSPCRLIETLAGKFFATRRFDRTADGGRLHFASAAGLLHANFRAPGDEYAVLFRLTDALTRDYSARKELFRRVALNVLAHNRDDHLKNFGFLMDDMGRWRLSPFYDFTYSEGPNGWQTLSVAGEGENPGEADLFRLAKDVSVDERDAMAIVTKVQQALATRHKPF